MPKGNDANTLTVATGNCAFCAVGHLLDQTAHTVMQDVYSAIGAPLPTGAMPKDDGSQGFNLYYFAKALGGKKPEEADKGANGMAYQIAGIILYLEKKGKKIVQEGTASKPLVFDQALSILKKQVDGTMVLALAGDDDGFGYISTLAHWTCGEIKSGAATFYDQQLNVSDANVINQLTNKLKWKQKIKVGEARVGSEPLGPLGQELGEKDKRTVLLIIQ